MIAEIEDMTISLLIEGNFDMIQKGFKCSFDCWINQISLKHGKKWSEI